MENNIMHKERSVDLLTCFISAPAGVNLSKIRQLLFEKGLELLHPSEIATYGQSISEKISELISQADLFLAVFDKSYESGNTFFELGIAASQRKQIIILSPPNFELPSDLTGFLFLRAGADNIEALGFAIDQLLEAPIIKKKKRQLKKSSIRTKPSTVKSIDLLEKFNLLSQGVTGYKLESFVAEMLKESGVIVRQSERHDYGADFAIWSDDLGTILGNPILINIKKSIRSHDQVKQITNQLTGYLQKTNSRSALVLYLEGIPSREAQNIARVFNIFFFQIGEFVQQIQDRSFVDVIRTRRNIVAHGGEV